MELINLSRILSKELRKQIDEVCEAFADGEEYRIIYGQLYVGAQPTSSSVLVDIINGTICDRYRTAKSIVLSKTRKQPYMKYRQIIIYFVKKYTQLIDEDIARFYDIDRVTVLHSIRAINNYLQTDPDFVTEIREIDEKLQRIFIKEQKDDNNS